MNPTSPIDRSRLSANRTSVGQRLLSSWFRRPALWSLICLCTATALVLVVHATNTENDHIKPSETARLLDATGRNGNEVMNTVLVNTISGTVFDTTGNPITGGRTVKLIQNGTLSGTTATSDSVTGIYTFTGLTLASGDKIAVYISGAPEKGATVTLSGTADITNLVIRQNALIVRTDNGGSITNVNLKEAEGGVADPDLTAVRTVDPSNVLSVPAGFTLEIWTGSTYAPFADINLGGNWRNNGTFLRVSETVTFNGNSNQAIGGSSSTTFNNLAIANTGDPNIPNNIVSLDGSGGATNTVAATLTVSNGAFDQGSASASSNLSLTGTGDVATIASTGTWENFGTGDITLNGDVSNNGIFEINANGKPCGQSDDILIRSSASGTQRTWKGTGTFSMTDVDVQDQKVPGGATLPLRILVASGTDHPGTNIGWAFRASCSGPFTWQGGGNNRWSSSNCWSPQRQTADDLFTEDELIFDGSVTPAPVVDEVPNQTNKSIHLTNGVLVTLAEPGGLSATLELNGATGQDLDVPAGTLLTLSGLLPFTIELTASGHQGQVAGEILLKDGAHQLIGANAGEITITGGVTIASSYSATEHPFGSGTNGSVVFESGSTGTFNRGLDPFGGADRTVATFNSGSTAHFLSTTAFFGNGGSYGNLILDGDAQNYFQAGANPITILNNLEIEPGNTFVLSSSPGADMNLYGNFVDKNVLSRGFTPNSRVMKFLGATQTVSKAAGGLAEFNEVLINQSPGGKVQLLSPTDIELLNLSTANALLELNGQVLELIGTVTGPGNLKGDPNAILAATGNGDVGTVNFVSGGRNLSGLILNRGTNGSMTLGTDVAVAGTLKLDNGKLNTGATMLSLAATSSVQRTNGYVVGNLQKSFGVSGNLGSFTFPLGTADAYSPLDANVTANTNGTLTAKAVQAKQPNIPGANALQRYWTLSGSGITADLTFHYRGGAPTAGDVVGNEGNYKIFKYDGSFTQFTPDATGSNSAADHFATLNNVSSFSDWTLAEPSVVQPGTISFLNAPYSDNETNANHNVTITVQRLDGGAGVVAVHYATGGGTATAGSDYTPVSGDLTWADGDTADKTFAIPIIGDTTFELDETVNITLSAPTGGATIGGTNPATLTITNDDAADTDISVSSGNLVISDASGGNTDDGLTLSLNAPNIRINDPNHTLSCGGGTPIDTHTCEIPLSSITGSIQVNTLGGLDTLTLALAGGNFFPPGGVSYNGGDPTTAPGDKLIITGGNQGTVTYHYNNAHDGTIGMSNIGTVTFTGLEPILNTGTAADIIFELPPGPNSATLGDDGTAGNTISRLSGATFETTDFSNPTSSLTIKRDDAADTVTVNPLPDFNASLAIGSGANPFSTITVGGPITLTGSRAVTLRAGDVTGGGNISTGGGLTVEVTGTNSTLSGVISGAGGLTKVGTGTLVVSGADTYTGATTVNAGRLNINGSITSNATVNVTATLGGAGSINSANTLTVSGGTVAPGTSPGILNTGNVSFSSNSILQVEIGGATPGNTASNHDQLNVTGTVSLGSATLILSSINGFVPGAGQSFVIINNDGSDAVTGTFNGLAEGATITNLLGSGVNATITYAGGTNSNDVVVQTVVPVCSPAPVVNNTGDNGGVNPAQGAGTGTLRQALVDVCAGGTITFDTADTFSTPQTITLSNQLTIGTDNVTIDGPDPATQRVTINGGGATRLFTTQSGQTATIRDLTLTGGLASGTSPADEGGAIFNDHGTLTLSGVTVSGNTAGIGGAIYNDGDAGLVATLTIVNSTISGNTANVGGGGAIYSTGVFSGGDAAVTLTNSTLSGNNAKGDGGGLYSDAAGLTPVTITNCTITNNRADTANGGSRKGGGLIILGSTLVTLRNSIVDLNFKGGSPSTTADDIVNSVVTGGASTHNLIGSCVSCGLTNGVDNNSLNVSAASLNIGALAANGAINQTHALLSGSVAINAGNAVTTLNGAINNIGDTVVLTDATAFPAVTGFTIRIDDEQMIVTNKVATVLTVTRGANGTTAVSHANLAAVSPAFDERGSGFLRLFGTQVDVGAFEEQTAHSAPVSADNARTIAEDNNYTFALADFAFSDPNDTPADTFTHVKVRLATAGVLLFDSDGPSGNPPVPVTLNQLIPVADITAGHLFFRPAADASGDPYATFQFAVQDSGGAGSDTSGNYTFTITVTPENDNPTLVKNAGLTVVIGGTGAIGNDKLRVDDVDNTAAQLVYTIGTAPANGTLKNGGIVLSGGGTFTQTAINAGQITYQHNGSATIADNFTFTVSDGAGGSIGLTTFNFTICPNPVVTSTADSGPGSLRQALVDVCPGGTIRFNTAGVFSTPQTITLSTQLTIATDNVTIEGPAPSSQRVTIHAGGASRLFSTQPGKTSTIRDLTLTGGSALNNFGGAISNDHATLTLIGVTVSGNTAQFGGAIYNNGGPPNGDGAATLTIINSTISGNTASAMGGAIYSSSSGANQNGATVNITNSTLSGNTATGSGGGLFSDGVGGITPVNITNCTITNNRAVSGGGLAIIGGTTATLRNSIVDLNFLGSTSNPSDISGPILSGGASTHNLVGDCSLCGLNDGADNNSLNVSAASLNIGALAANGAINQTHALLPGSIAINAGNNAYVVAPPFLNASPITDERGTGFVRLIGAQVDIGAFEAGHLAPTSADNARTIAEDNSYTFALADFAFTDPDIPADTFTNVKITLLATAGTLYFDADGAGGNPPVALILNQLIPVAEITAGHLFFTPAPGASGNPYATFQFAVQDNGTTANGGSDLSTSSTFTIAVSPQNDAPTLTTNAGLSVANGGTATIDNTKLKVDDIDNIAAQLVYTIGTAPANGTLKYGAFVLPAGGTFTQADINGNQINYQHNGSATFTDSFTFTVSDGAGGSIGSTTFNITICGNPVVTNTNDSGAGSLRQALADVCPGGTITFDSAGVFATPQTITLSSQLTIGTDMVTIDGPDPSGQRVTIAGGGTSRLFSTQSGKTTTIRDLTLTGGSAPGGFGGAIYNDHATLTLTGVAVSGNTAGSGGGIYNDGSSGGTAALTIVNSTISGNSANVSDGGAIYNFGTGGRATLDLTNSTLSGNQANGSGGGVFTDGPGGGAAAVTITNSTITNNRADNNTDSSGVGGGIVITGSSEVVLRNSIVDLNFNGGSPSTTADDIRGAVVAGGFSTHNLIGSCVQSCGLTNGVNNNQLNVSAASLNIGALAANGAINQTNALLPGSIAIEAGNDAYVLAPPFLNVSPITDERGTGFVRLFGAHVDIGAFEAGHFAPSSADNARTIAEDNNYIFAPADFAFSDPDVPADTFTNVKITSLATAGTLFLDADGAGGSPPVSVIVNQIIPVDDITAGHLFFTPAVNANGVPYATFQFAVQDSGPTGNGGSDLSTNYTFTMNVTAVNDAPTFQIAGDPPTVNEDAGPQTVSGFASNFQPGPPTATDETGQTLVGYTLSLTVSTGGLTFSSGPAINNTGTLTYTTTAHTSGTATFNIVATDSGSGSAPNVNQSAPVSFTITVDPQNDVPTLTTNAGLSVANGGTATIDNARLLVSDIDNTPDQLVYTIGTAPANGTLKKNGVALTGSGTFTQDDINNGRITYQHNGSATLTDSFTFTVSDGAGGSIGSTTFNITITCGNSVIVTSNADSGNGTLRQAIAAICDGGTITFDMNQLVSPIPLASGLTINKNLTIQGPGANVLTITGNDTFGLINGNTAGINVNIDGLSFTHGGPDTGHAVAIEFDGAGTLTVSNCEFSANTDSSMSKAVIFTSLSTGLTLKASTFRNNTTLNTILSDRTPLTVVNSTISNNSGPGINSSAVGSTVTNSTIADNGIGVQSDGGLCGGCAASLTVTNSLLSSNGGQNIRTTGGGTITSGGHNLIDDATSAAFTNPADPTNIIVSPGTTGIAALANNGGPTMTRALMSGSPALDAGDNSAATNAGLTTDQRGAGFNRIADGPDADTTATVDIGAFEAQLSATNATTNEDTQTASGLVISRDDAEGAGVTNFKITNITNGTLFQNDGMIQINSGDFISVAEGNAGLKFMPAANLFSPATTFSFQAQAALSNSDAGLVGGLTTATITVNPVADTPSVTNATTGVNVQTSSGLVISRNAVDGNEVTNFKITNITGGTLFKNDGTTRISNNDFITFTEGNAGLKFTPALNSTSTGSFDVRGATSNSGTGLSSAATATITVACGSTIVTNSNDGGAGSLRSIINAACAGATLTFDITPGQVISPIALTSGELTINKNLTITGPAANLLAISGNNTFRLMKVTGSGVNLTINHLSFTGGGGNQLAAAIEFDNAGILTINDSEFYGNSNSIGGAIYANQSAGMAINRSCVHNNTTPVGIEGSLTPLSVLNSTVSNNTGYGIGNFSSNLTLTNSTIAENGGNGIGNNSQIGSVSSTLSNVLISHNGGHNLDKAGANSNTFSSNGRNVIDDNAFSLLAAPGPGDLLGTAVPARLAPLAFNGGTTQTRALLPGSAAFDNGDNTLTTDAGLTTDQRGLGRIVDGPDADTTDTVDIGAFEAQVSVEDITDKTTNEDTQLQFTFNVGDVANITSVTATSSDAMLVPNNVANIAVSGPGSTRTLTINPAANLSGTSTITITVNGTNSQSMTDTFELTVNPVADTPSVTNASTTVNLQTTSGLVISRGPADGAEVTNFKITNIAGGSLFKNNGTTQINDGNFITFAEGNAGLKFTPALNSTANGSFQVQASLSGSDAGLGGGFAIATISVNCGATVVTNSNDNGAGSLRDTILHACDGATITFDMTPDHVTNPIALTSGQLLTSKNLIIQGPNANVLTLQRSAATGTPLFSIFNIPSGLSLTLSGLTLSNADKASNGGAIRNAGTLSLNSMALTNNHTAAAGSALFNAQTGSATIANSTFSNNRSDEFAAIYNQGGSLNLTNSTLSANANLGNAPGAAIFSESFAGVTNITNATISQNSGQAAVVWRNGNSGALVNLKNTIVSGNTGGDVDGTTDLGNNLTGGNALLTALGNYGGPTQTMALLPGSPAINAGTATGAPTTDQRGTSRVGAVDIGAFESRGFAISAASGTPQSATILSAFGSPLIASVTGVGGEPVNGGVVRFTAPAANASAVLTGGGSTANVSIASGQASTNSTANGIAGSYNVSAGATGATSASFSLTNSNAATTTAVTSSLNPSDLNQSVTFTAKVTGATTPTGTVQFKDNGSNLGSPLALNGAGVAQLTTSTLTVGNHAITANYGGDVNVLPSTGALAGGQTVLFRQFIKFSQPTYSVNEDGNVITITVIRQGDTSLPVTVDYATPDDSASLTVLPCSNANGVASPRCDFTTALGTLRFAAGETSKTFNVLISQDLWLEGNETAQLTLSNPTGGAAFQQPGDAIAVLTIVDDDTTPPATNAIDDSTTFVRQHYHDFLNREPDTPGLNFWVNQIEGCGADTQCRAVKRINVSAAFFLSIEFQNTGYFVERMYKAGFGDIAPPTVPVPVRFTNFLADSQEIRGNIIVGQGNWQSQIDDAKRAFALAFVQRTAFLNRYPALTSAEAFVDSLNANAGNVLSDAERSALVAELSPNPADTALRADVLRNVAENSVLQQQEFNRAFVLMQYFGYLRRNPDAAPEATLSFAGYNFWLGKLNQFNGDYVGAELIKAFITSGEYRGRFGP